MVKDKRILVLILFLSSFWVFNSVKSASLPVANHPMFFGYYKADSNYGDYKADVKNYVNTFMVEAGAFLITDISQPSEVDRSFRQIIALSRDIILEVATWNQQTIDDTLTAATPYWNNVDYILLYDEPNWDKTTTEQKINEFKTLLGQKGLSSKPIAINFTPAQILSNTGYQASNLDLVGTEAYIDPAQQDSPSLVTNLNNQIDQLKQKIGNKKMFFVVQAYDRNGAWKNLNSLQSIQSLPYLKAYNDPNVIGLLMFSYARQGGSKDHPELKTEHQNIWAAINGNSTPSGTNPTPTTNPSPSFCKPIPNYNVQNYCIDVYRTGARARDDTALYSECRDVTWMYRNTNTAVANSNDFTYHGIPASTWKNWADNEAKAVLDACAKVNHDGHDSPEDVNNLLNVLENYWKNCIPRKGITCVPNPDTPECQPYAQFITGGGVVGSPTRTCEKTGPLPVKTPEKNPVDDVKLVATKSIGGGVFPDVALYNDKAWVAVVQGRALNLYSGSVDLSDLKIQKSVNISGGNVFPRLTVYKNTLWLAYKDGTDNKIKLWRSDTDSIESIGLGYGNDPVTLGNGYMAWQSTPTYDIKIREIDSGSVGNGGEGKPTGLSRITETGLVITVDDDRNIVSYGTRPSFAGALAIVEGKNLGAPVGYPYADTPLYTAFEGQIANTPRLASDGQGNYAVVTWGGSPSAFFQNKWFANIINTAFGAEAAGGVRVSTLQGPTSLETIDTGPTTTVVGQPFGSTTPIAAPTQGLPTDLGQLIQQIFGWSLTVLGIAVFVMIFYAGFLWLTAAGNTARIGEAKSRITNAAFGAVLLLSSYLILYTINPDFVKSTFSLPGLGKSSATPTTTQGPPPPTDALTKHPSQSAVVASIKSQLESTGVRFVTDCEVFEITKRVAWQLKDEGVGLFKKSSGEGVCDGFSIKRIVYSDGYLFKILSDAGVGGANGPQWVPDSCGPANGDGTCPDLYSSPVNPGP